MQADRFRLAIVSLVTVTLWPTLAAAQQAMTGEQLMALERDDLRTEIGTRYDASLALVQDPAVVSADNNRFMWASQAKAQCGIAIGFLKSGERDPVSVGKCADAYNRMQVQAAPLMAAAPVPAQIAQDCSQTEPAIVFFEWNSAVLPDSVMSTLDTVAANQRRCGWAGLAVVGHTDRSGSNGYNIGLSERRAAAVASALEGRGIGSSALDVSGRGEAEPKVPTPDGEQSPTNRRVEITVN